MSLSPPVKRMEFGLQDASKFLAESTVRNLFDLSWSSQFSYAIIVGGDNENKMLRLIARFSFLKIFKNIEYRNKEPKPIQIENA